jgi:hypothetical protein
MTAKKATKETPDKVPEKRRRLRKSQLRKTLAKLTELEPYSLELVEKSVKQQDVDKESLQTAKWVLNSLISFSKAAIAEEDTINGLRLKMNAQADADDNEQEEEEKPSGAVFSLFVNSAKQDKE